MLHKQNHIRYRVTKNLVNKTGEQQKWEKGCLLEKFSCEVIFAEAEASI